MDPCNFDSTPGATCSDGGPAGSLVGFTPTMPQVGGDICEDSGGLDDMGDPVTDMAMTFLPLMPPFVDGQSDLNDPCLDFGYVPVACEIEVDKTCCIPTPPTAFDCSDAKPVTSLTLIWDGPSGVDELTEGGQLVSGVQNGEEVVIETAGLGNDVDVEIGGAVSGESRFHVSCSDQAMNGPEDCGSAQGNGKGDDADLLNRWLLEGITGENGALDCTP